MTLTDYLQLLRRGWFVVVLAALVGGGAGAVVNARAVPTYVSQASLAVTVASDGSTGSLVSAGSYAVTRAKTYAALAATDTVLERVALATGDDPRVLRGAVGAEVREGTAIIDVSAAGPSAAAAAARTQAVADELAVQGQTLDRQYPGGPVELTVVSRASEGAAPVGGASPNNVIIGVVIGLALGVAAVVVAHSLDDKMRSAADLPRQLRFGSVTSLPLAKRGAASRATTGPRAESLRRLRSTLDVVATGGGVVTVAGTSAPVEVAPLAEQLARVMGEVGLRVVVVDVDFSRPPTEPPAGRPGIGDVLMGRCGVSEVVRENPDVGVFEIARGDGDQTTAQLLGTTLMQNVLGDLAERFDYVLLATPPMRERAESAVLAALSTAVLLVAVAGSTRRRELLHALELVSGLGVKNVSLVLDGVRRSDLGRVATFTAHQAATSNGRTA